MRGFDDQTDALFCYLSPDSFVPKDHPLRAIRKMVDEALADLSSDFSNMYSKVGRPSIPPEKLLRALLIQALYSIRSNRMLMEQIGYSILFRWFIGLSLDAKVWDHSVYSHNQERMLAGDIAAKFFRAVLDRARREGLLSDEHFSVDGTLIEAWASIKSFRKKEDPPSSPPVGRNETRDFRGEKLSNETHASNTDPEARLYRKGDGEKAKLAFTGHVLMENRNGLAMEAVLTQATGTVEHEAAVEMVSRLPGDHRITVGGDKNYDTADVVGVLRELNATPHVAQNNTNRRSAIDKRTTRHAGYSASLRSRKRVEEIFGWLKTVAEFRKTRHRGVLKVGWLFTMAVSAYNLVRMRKLIPVVA